jgi:hypothetical protein
VLPGEPFDPPAASQVPAPRPAEEAPAAPEAAAPPAAWNYQPMAAPEGAPVYQSGPTTYEPQPIGGSDFDALHEFATLPQASQFGAPAPATEAFAPASYPLPPAAPPAFVPAQPEATFPPPVFAPSEPPLPPAQDDEGLLAEPGKKRSDRKSVDKRLVAVALVALVAGGGYFGYTQMSKKSSSTPNVVTPPAAAPVVHYDFPSNVAGLPLQSTAASAAFRTDVTAQVKAWNPTLARSMSFASYSSGQPAIVVMAFHPAPAQLVADYSALIAKTAKPGTGDVAVASHVAVPGAAGGHMTCGGIRGSVDSSWCAWRGTSTIGVTIVTGSPKTQINEILTRELRAYAEH